MHDPYPSIRQAVWLLVLAGLLAIACTIPILMVGAVLDLPVVGHPLAIGIANRIFTIDELVCTPVFSSKRWR